MSTGAIPGFVLFFGEMIIFVENEEEMYKCQAGPVFCNENVRIFSPVCFTIAKVAVHDVTD